VQIILVNIVGVGDYHDTIDRHHKVVFLKPIMRFTGKADGQYRRVPACNIAYLAIDACLSMLPLVNAVVCVCRIAFIISIRNDDIYVR